MNNKIFIINSAPNTDKLNEVIKQYKKRNIETSIILINSLNKKFEMPGVNIFHLVCDDRYFTNLDPFSIDQDRLKLLTLNTVVSDLPFLPFLKLRNLGRMGFSKNIIDGIYHGCASFYTGLQIAYSFGATEICLLGTSYDYGITVNRGYSKKVDILPDPFITETYLCLQDYCFPEFERANILFKLDRSSVFVGIDKYVKYI